MFLTLEEVKKITAPTPEMKAKLLEVAELAGKVWIPNEIINDFIKEETK
jgi:hypothetical protein